MSDPTPHTPAGETSTQLSIRLIVAVYIYELAVIRDLIKQRDGWQRMALVQLGAVEAFEEADRTCAYWRQRALDAEGLADALRRAQSTHVCKEDQ